MVEPVCAVMDSNARMFPAKMVLVFKVAELPTCQNTRLGSAPLMRLTTLAEEVVNVLPILKTKTADASLCASSVRFPDNWAEVLNV